ncbi:MAG: hypothetical protein IPJ41_16110 [Phycisphaerales bacterium]|nr:hypothetical protein [Phycisphaerales bacterium]
MHRSFRIRATVLLASVGLASPLWAQDGTRPFMTFDHTGMSSFFVDQRDAGLRDALAMLPDRVAELPAELENMPPEAAGLIQLFLKTIAKPARVAILYDGDNPSGGFFGYGFVASVQCANEGEVDEIRDAILGLTNQITEERGVEIPLEPSKRFKGMSEMMLPFGLLSFGPRKAESGWRYEIVVGTVNDPDGAFAQPMSLVEERGFKSFLTGSVDFSTLTPASKLVRNFAGTQNEMVNEFLGRFTEMGLIGDEAMRIEFQAGATPSASVSKMIVRGAAKYAKHLALPTEAITAAELRAVPADAYGASIGKASFASIDRAVEQMTEQGLPVQNFLDEFEDATGVDLVEDVFHSLGGTFALYNAESTGGGSLLSAVAMMTIKDHDRFTDALRSLANVANDKLEEAGKPGMYVAIEHWVPEAGIDVLSLRFPGLPVPFEFSFAMTDSWFIGALTPQAAVAAARQAIGKGDDGLTANPRFAPVFKEHGKGATQISFVDTPRSLRAGYPILSLMASGVSNLVRSPTDHGVRDPGMILPLYRDLLGSNPVASVRITRWEGEDLVTSGWGDRSLLVNAGGDMGVASAALPLAAAAIGVGGFVTQQMDHGWSGPVGSFDTYASLIEGRLLGDPTTGLATLVSGVTSPASLALPPAWGSLRP